MDTMLSVKVVPKASGTMADGRPTRLSGAFWLTSTTSC